MFQPPRYIQSSFSIHFPRQNAIRRKANEFEDFLGSKYNQPQILPVPDDMAPEIPRILFESAHGHSQIVVSQINMSLDVSYSSDWQDDISKGKEYLDERVLILFELAGMLGNEEKIHFCGIVTRARLISQESDKKIISRMSDVFLLKQGDSELHDLEVRKTTIFAQKYYSNMAIKNFRAWQFPTDSAFHPPRAHHNQVVERGLEITGDFNDRFGYNQGADYYSGRDEAEFLIGQGVSEVRQVIAHIEE